MNMLILKQISDMSLAIYSGSDKKYIQKRFIPDQTIYWNDCMMNDASCQVELLWYAKKSVQLQAIAADAQNTSLMVVEWV